MFFTGKDFIGVKLLFRVLVNRRYEDKAPSGFYSFSSPWYSQWGRKTGENFWLSVQKKSTEKRENSAVKQIFCLGIHERGVKRFFSRQKEAAADRREILLRLDAVKGFASFCGKINLAYFLFNLLYFYKKS